MPYVEMVRGPVGRSCRLACALVVGLASFWPHHTEAQQGKSLSGVILDAYSGQALSGIRVTAVLQERSTLTDGEGRFTLTRLAPGKTVVRLQGEDYVTEVQEVEPSAPSSIVELTLTPLTTILEELSVVVSPEAGSRQLLDPRTRRMAGSVADFLQSRAAGLDLRRAGVAGERTGAVRVRGSSSISLTNDPLIFVDGVRIASIDILDDIALSDVASVEIVRGPEAMSYGLDSGHGVILIRMRSGASEELGKH